MDQPRRRRGRHLAGLERQFKFFPDRGQAGDGSRGIDRLPVVAHHGHFERPGKVGPRPGQDGRVIPRLRLHRNPPIPAVGDAGGMRCVRLGDRQPQTHRELVIKGIGGVERQDHGRIRVADGGPMRRCGWVIEKGAVLNQLGIQPAVVGMIDLLGHQTVEERTHLAGGMGGVNGEGGVSGETAGSGEGAEGEGGEWLHG